MKKTYTASFKAQVVLELLKKTKTLSQLSSEHGVHVTVLRDWKQVALKGLPDRSRIVTRLPMPKPLMSARLKTCMLRLAA